MMRSMESINILPPPSDAGKAARAAKTAAARAVLKERLNGLSTLEYGRERERKALDWIYRWGWASATTIETLVGSVASKSGLSQRLIRNQLVISTKTVSRRSDKYLPAAFLTLTAEGKRVAERPLKTHIQYEMRPERVNQNLLVHDEMAQRTTARLMASKSILGFLTENEMRQKSQEGVKNPDACLIYHDNTKVSVEIELSPKWERDLDVFVRSTLLSLNPKTEGGPRFDHLVIVTDSVAIFDRYSEAFAPDAPYGFWKKNDLGRWIKIEERRVPAWAKEKISWKMLDQP